MKSRVALITVLSAVAVPLLAAPAQASPHPSSSAVEHATQGCAAVTGNFDRNPATIAARSETGLAHFSAVGEAFCGG